jgi:hypothetical protein
MGFVEIELIVEVCGISDFLGDRGVANPIFEGLFETIIYASTLTIMAMKPRPHKIHQRSIPV